MKDGETSMYRKEQNTDNRLTGRHNMSDKANCSMGTQGMKGEKSRGEPGVSKLPQPK